MAINYDGKAFTLLSASNYSTMQYRLGYNSGEYFVRQTASGGFITGVLYNKPTAQGRAARVVPIQVGVPIKVRAGATLTINGTTFLKCDNAGRAIDVSWSAGDTVGPSGTTADFIFGRPMEAGGGSGTVIGFIGVTALRY